MHNIWNERENPPQTEQRLADQIRAIKNNWLSKTEIEELRRNVTPQEEMRLEAQENEPYEEADLLMGMVEEDANHMQERTPDQIEKTREVKTVDAARYG